MTFEGRPVAGAKLAVGGYSKPRDPNGDPASRAAKPNFQIVLPPWEPAIVSDAQGRVTLPAAVGYGVYFDVTAEGYAGGRFTAAAGSELEPALVRPGSVAIAVVGVDAALVKGANYRLEAGSRVRPGPGTHPLPYRAGTLDGTPTQLVTGLRPGKYALTVSNSGEVAATFDKAGRGGGQGRRGGTGDSNVRTDDNGHRQGRRRARQTASPGCGWTPRFTPGRTC